MIVFVAALLTLVMALVTWTLGWWALLVVALIAGAKWRRPALIALAGALSWAALLAFDAQGGRLATLGGMLGGIFPVPGVVLMAITLAFAALAAWSAATVGAALGQLSQRTD